MKNQGKSLSELTLKNQYDPVECLRQLSREMENLSYQAQFLQRVVQKYSQEQVMQLLPKVIESFIKEQQQLVDNYIQKKTQTHQLDQAGIESQKRDIGQYGQQAKGLFQKLKVDFIQKFTVQQFKESKAAIDKEITIKESNLNKDFACKCGRTFPTFQGLHYHQKRNKQCVKTWLALEEQQPVEKEKSIKNPRKTTRRRKSKKQENSSQLYDSSY